MTKTFCTNLKLPLPDSTFNLNYDFIFEDINIECRFLGGGHSADNIIVYFPEKKILFGGCLIKSAGSQSIGNTADAVLYEWESTVEKIVTHYPNIGIVIPGHGNYGNALLLSNTIKIVRNYNQQKNIE